MTRQRLGWLLVVGQFALLWLVIAVPRRPMTAASVVVGGVLVIAGIALGVWSSRALGSALTPTPVPVADAGLRTGGPYRSVRHPIYSAILLAGIGWLVAVGTWWTAFVLVVLAGFLLAKSRWEDSLLRAEYGAPWQEWARNTGALLPRFSRRP